ncbi:hypothetical protein [Flavobacterium sp.]|uniref:hypothetical protein n=1 Tax=Flavobacterium sp. TaxID=239 RepID=UPI0035295956
MKWKLLILFLIPLWVSSQNFYLKINGSSAKETHIIDSIGYKKENSSVALVLESQKTFEQKLLSNGFFSYQLKDQKKVNDSTFTFFYSLGNRINSIAIVTNQIKNEEKELLSLQTDTIYLKPNEVESWIQLKLAVLEQNGYALSKLKLINQKQRNTTIFAELNLSLNNKRMVNDLVVLGYTKFPKNIKKNWLKKYKKQNFNQALLTEITNDIEAFPFVMQTRNPELLFTKDSTKIYTYLEKTKPNTFDGFIGFANDAENTKLIFSGYLDLHLINILNGGEKFKLNWRNDGNKQTSFHLGTEIPYVFKSPIGTKANLKIFKQDSIFQNTQFNFDLGYYFSYTKKIFVGYQSIVSTDIQNANSISLNNYNSVFYTLTFDYAKRNITSFIFPEKAKILLTTGIGNRTILQQKTKQFLAQLNAFYNLNLNEKNSINLKNETFYLESNAYVVNELYRFGGINSIRGFRENTLQANFFSGIMAEYRYLLSPSVYVNSITDYGYFQDKTANLKGNLLGLGFGFGMLTKNGLFQFVYANGSTNDHAIKLSNSIVQISFTTNF